MYPKRKEQGMTDREIIDTFKKIADTDREIAYTIVDTLESIIKQQDIIIASLNAHGDAIKLLLDESIAKDQGLLSTLDEQAEDFFKEVLKK